MPPRVWLLVLVGLGLAYDSAVFGLGALIGEGATLHGMSVGRFVGHVVLTPLLVVWAGEWLLPGRRVWAWLFAGALVIWGVLEDLVHLSLIPREYAGTLRYVPETPSGPPFPALVVSAVLLIAGIMLWRRAGWPWLALATLVLIAASAAAFAVPPLGNAGEAVLLAALVATERGSGRREPRDNQRRGFTAPPLLLVFRRARTG
ncbi:hypothetical protein HLB23_01235 [Nocardia uniformis]|uniref:Uncharacterized protein n=1 Tax=Nocardia uniformis TaxID=53432 RepID=A0A849BUI2_9NOCA|nr:hypothetical protein [Nocardia uniformis]NNH68516.1 hypothetical protein [Nocardia uniformis]